ncbi:hypothetical protein OH492_19390 [Vibrio chagasii]|nr:hypothetical protein [Vibrio chagasii]
MLGVAHVLYNEGLYDKKFIETYCLGFEDFIKYVQGETKDKAEDPEWASLSVAPARPSVTSLRCWLTVVHKFLLVGVSSVNTVSSLTSDVCSYRSNGWSNWSTRRWYLLRSPLLWRIGVSSTGFAAPGSFPLNIDQGQKPKYTNTDYNGYSRVIPVARWLIAC